MKNNITLDLLLTLLLLFTFVGCDNFLEENPDSLITSENFFQTESDAIAGVNAIYTVLNDNGYYGRNFWEFADVSADNANAGELEGGVDALDFIGADDGFRNYWTSIYRGINNANTVLSAVPSIEFDEKLKNRILGEAQFLRALLYFDLVRSFGGVPLITEPTIDDSNNQIPRASAEEIYDLVINDLLQAESLLPDSYGGSDVGRPTSGAAKSLLAKVYLTLQDWGNAREKADEVIQSGAYSLFQDFRDVFRVENENGQEHIFSIQFEAGGADAVASSFTSDFASRNPDILLGLGTGLRAGAGIAAEQEFFDNYPDHYRKNITMIDSFPTPFFPEIMGEESGVAQAGPACMKYWDPTIPDENQGDANWMVLRYADVLLMFAEAENELSGPTPAAYNAINQVRKRARDANADGVDDPDELAALPDLSGLSTNEFRQAVLRERELELCFEGHRRWDLLRRNMFVEELQASGKPAEARHILFPIPSLEILANPSLTQNPGYPQ